MKAISKFLSLAMLATIALPVSAQQEKKKIEKKEEIIINKSGDKTEKMTIVVDGDNITINGLPLDEYEKNNGEVKIIKRKTLKDGDDDMDVDVLVTPRVPDIALAPKAPRAPQMRFYNFNDNEESAPRAYLGVMSKDNAKGAEITGVKENTAAAKAGLKEGDVITKVGSKAVNGPSSLLEAVKANKPNDEVEITYLRDGKEKKVKAKLGEIKEMNRRFTIESPEMPDMNFNFDDKWADEFRNNMKEFRLEDNGDGPRFFEMVKSRPKLGAKISDIEDADGVKVMEVEAETAGAKAGLLKDDIIIEIDGKKIKNTDDAREALTGAREKSNYQVKIKRGNDIKILDVKVPKKIKTANL
jgi:serine protease Do